MIAPYNIFFHFQVEDPHLYMSQYDHGENFLPLISELGIKAKSENGKESRDPSPGPSVPPETSSEPPSTSFAATKADEVNTSAKGKALWILGDN